MVAQEPTAPVLPPSSNLTARVKEIPASSNCTGPGYSVEGSEELRYTYSFVDNVFDQKKNDLASYYTKWGRVLCILDETVHGFYGDSIRACELNGFPKDKAEYLSTLAEPFHPGQTLNHTISSLPYTSSRVVN